MAQPAVTLKPNSPLGGPTEPHPQSPAGPRWDAMKFSYATGAQPLDGFTIKRGIGIGGFGEVYYAVSDAGKEVALKRIQRHLDIELRGVGQCLNLKHPNLVSLFDIRYDDQGEAWVVMEYVVGESLRDALDRCPEGLPLGEALHWFVGMSAGVAYLHDRGIVHRDLKPGNLFSDEGVVKIGDYGLSKFISCSRRSGQTESVGTFHYMAPEIGRGSYGKQIDIYALGVILYELLTGRVPFEGESTQEIIMKHLTADPDLSVAPTAFRDVIRKSLMKDPEKRYRNVGEMVEAVQTAFAAAGLKSDGAAVGPRMPRMAPPATAYVPAAGIPAAIGPQYVEARVAPGMPVGVPVGAPAHHAARPAGAAAGGAASLGSPTPGAAVPGAAVPGVAANVVPEEPIAAAIRHAIDDVLAWINDPKTNGWTRAIVIGVVVIGLYWNAAWLIPLAVALGIAYLVYYAVRLIVMGPPTPTPPQPQQAAPVAAHHATMNPVPAASPFAPTPNAAPAVPYDARQVQAAVAQTDKVKRRMKTSEAVRALLDRRPRVELARELIGAILVAPLVAAILTAVTLMLSDRSGGLSIHTISMFAWVWGTTVVGSWAILVLGKLWEHSNGEDVWRRFAMLVTGMGVGLAAWGLGAYLQLEFEHVSQAAVRLPGIGERFYEAKTLQPALSAYLLYFGFQFLALRWWRQADSLRYSRLSLWDTGVCVIGALIVSRFIPFATPWSLLLPAAMSLTIQLSAPWINQQERSKLREQVGVAA